MNNTFAKLIRAARGPVLLMTLGALLAVNQFTGVNFNQTFPVLIIVFGLMWLLERMAPRRAADMVVNVAAPSMAPLPPIQPHDPLSYDPLREVHRNVYGDIPAPVRAAAPKPVMVDPNQEIPTAEHPIRQQQQPKDGKL